jgi:FkbM family methyltransferase
MDKISYKSNHNRTIDYVKNFDRERVLKSLVDTDSPIIFDVGSNIGQTLTQFKEWWPNSEVYCFEPVKEFYDELKTLPYNKVVYNNFALGDKTEDDIDFYYHKVQPMLSGFDKINVNSSDSIAINNSKLVDMKDGEYVENVNDVIKVKVKQLKRYI